MARGNTITIGREGVDIEFPDDRFISGRHCTIEVSGSVDTCSLTSVQEMVLLFRLTLR